MREQDDPISLARAFWAMAIVYTFPSSIRAAERYLLRSVDIIRRHNLRFVPMSTGDTTQQVGISSFIPPFSEQLHERIAFLADMLHVETFLYIAGQPGGPYYYHDASVYISVLPVRILVFYFTEN
jgi:hypothetical protein